MSITDDMVTYLKARSGLMSLLVAPGIYPLLVPQGAQYYPAISYQTIDNLSDVALDGPTGLAWELVQISCWARKKSDVTPIRNAVVDALSGYKGTFASTTVQACLKGSERDLDDLSPGLENARIYGRAIDFKIWFNEPIPTYA